MTTRKAKDAQHDDSVTDYRHKNVTRLNIPPAGLAARGPIVKEKQVRYAYNPHLTPALRFDATGRADRIQELVEQAGKRKLEPDEVAILEEALRNHEPWLEWAGKREQQWCVADPVALNIHERISTQAILRVAKRQDIQRSLFADPEQEYREAVQFYKHKMDWTNRMVLGDSLAVMASLARREALAGKVQMVYMDPPYGIKYASNFQPEVGRRDVSDREHDLTREPEMVKAYRDTWTLGVHSYLSYLRDRLLLCKELLADSGSIFVQISDENVHRVRALMDEVFGPDNFIVLLTFTKKGSQTGDFVPPINEYLLWFARERESAYQRFKQLYAERDSDEDNGFPYCELANGEVVGLEEVSKRSLAPHEFRRFSSNALFSQKPGPNDTVTLRGKAYPSGGNSWKIATTRVPLLDNAGRALISHNRVRYKRYANDFTATAITNVWTGLAGASDKVYIVQTNSEVIERCLLMTTDPGDLVLDPTCVRKGTRVLVVWPPCGSPVNGGTAHAPINGGPPTPSPLTGKVGMGYLPIEDLAPGDYILAHDGQPHRVVRAIHKRHSGPMVGIRVAHSTEVLWLTGDHRVLCQLRTRSYGGERSWKHVPKENFPRARQMRRAPTAAEQALWQALRFEQLGVKFRRQHPIGPYIADFYSHDAGMVVEVDGDTHSTAEAQGHDAKRTAYFQSLGLNVSRFTNLEALQEREGVVESIMQTLEETEPSEDHYRQWRQAHSLREGDIVYCCPPVVPPSTGGRTLAPSTGGQTPFPVDGEHPIPTFPVDGEGEDGAPLLPAEIVSVEMQHTDEEVYDLEVEGAHSFLTELCAVHNCGSGTTAYVAEEWGRRWITIDVSRVALAIARQRLLTAKYDYYRLRPTSAEDVQRNPEGPWLTDPAGQIPGTCTFECKTVPHIMLKSIAQNQALDPIFEKWEPLLAAKLEALNQALRQTVTKELRFKLLAKLQDKQKREGKRAVTDADQRRWVLPPSSPPVNGGITGGWKEWEVPFDTDPDWPKPLQDALTDYRRAWRQKMDEVNACIAARADSEELVDQPFVDRGKVRVSGPFTVEGVIPAEESIDDGPPLAPPLTGGLEESPIAGAPEELETFGEGDGPVQTEAQNTEAYLDRMIRLLREDGVRFPDNKVMKFSTLEAATGSAVLHAEGTWANGDQKERRVAVAFGPQYGPLTVVVVEEAIRSAARRGYDDIVFAAFSFSGEAQVTIQEVQDPAIKLHMAQIRPDVNMGDLLKTTVSSQLFTVSGSPRTRVEQDKDGQYIVHMEGVDLYDPVTNSVRSTGAEKVAAWFLDGDYDGRCFCVCQAFFPDKTAWEKLGKALGGTLDGDAFASLSGTVSLPFPEGPHKRIAVKVIDPRGNEVLRVHRLGQARYDQR